MIEFTLTDKKWLYPLPLRIKYYIFKFIAYLCSKNILETEIRLITSFGKFVYKDIMDVPLSIVNMETGETYHTLVEDLHVVHKVVLWSKKETCV